MTISPFDRRVLDAYLACAEAEHHGHAQAICAHMGHRLTPANLARVLRAIHRLTAAAREHHALTQAHQRRRG